MDIGSIWNGWEIAELIGEGAFGKVYRIVRDEYGYAYDSALKVIRIPQNKSEIKSIRQEGMSEESITTYFESMVKDIVAEFAIMSQLRGDSNIVSFEDHSVKKLEDDFGWEIYIRMELLTPLFDYLLDHTMTIRDVIQLGIDMCKALEVCQKYNIIHRDIKPENIFVSKQGHYKLGDFGIARQLEKTSSGLSKKGTYSYMAPEVYKGQAYNSTVDIYSLGVVLYRFMNNNRTPFLPAYPEPIHYSDREIANVKRMSGEELPIPCNAKGRLAEIILKACSYNPKDRYESALEMRKALESISYSEEESKIIYPAGDILTKVMPTSSKQSFFGEKEEMETLPLIVASPEEKPEIETNKNTNNEFRQDEGENREQTEETLTIQIEENNIEENNPIEKDKKDKETVQKNRQEEPQKQKQNNTKKPALILSLLLIIGMTCCAPFVYLYYHHEVPELGNVNEKNAIKLLEDEGLKYNEEGREFSDNIERGSVISQSIKGGSKVKKGTVINVVISRGEAIEVPDLTEKDIETATKEVEAKGLLIEVEKKKYSDKVSKGRIISQTPENGAICEQGETIKVIKSKGIEQEEVPDVEGKTQEQAEKALNKAKLKSEVVTAYSSNIDSGKVISQSKEAGKKIDKNSTVTITVSVGPAPVYKSSRGSSSSNKRKKSSGGRSARGTKMR